MCIRDSLWREPAGEVVNRKAPDWMGELESIQSGRAWQFQGQEPLLRREYGHRAV